MQPLLYQTLKLGFEREREGGDKEWSKGPTFDLVLPVFDQGQAKRKKAQLEIKRAQALYWDKAIKIRSAARTTRNRLMMGKNKSCFIKKQCCRKCKKS